MTDTKISALTGATTPLAGTEVVPLVQSSTTKNVSVANLTAGRSVSANDLTLSGGTANGVLYLNGSKVATSGSALTFDGTNLGIGTSPSRLLDVSGAAPVRINTTANNQIVLAVSGTAYGQIFSNSVNAFGITDGGSTGTILNLTQTGNLVLNTGNLVIGTSGKGIDFSATSHAAGMTSELLSDYEEGTWTPVLTDLTNNATMGATTYGRYTKIGRQVFLQGAVEVSSLGSVSGNIYISGVPFTLPGLAVTNGVGRAGALSIPANSSVGLYAHSSNVISLWLWDATTGTTFMQASEFTASGYIFFSFSFIV